MSVNLELQYYWSFDKVLPPDKLKHTAINNLKAQTISNTFFRLMFIVRTQMLQDKHVNYTSHVLGWSLCRTIHIETKHLCIPIIMCTASPVTLCSLTSTSWGFSPGAWVLLYTLRADTWVMHLTDAATKNGNPIIPPMAAKQPISSRSRW